MQPGQAGTLCEWVLHLLQLYSAYNLGQVPALCCLNNSHEWHRRVLP